MKTLAEYVAAFVVIVAWISGIVLAKGFWSTAFAIFIPPWGWYLVAEKALQSVGWV